MTIASSVLQSSEPVTPCPWEWRGHSIYAVRIGEARPDCPPLLCVHGFGASTDHWRKNLLGWQDKFEVWAIDLLGFGRSAKPVEEYSGDLWRDQLHEFITEVIGRPVVILGNSLGGYASLCVAGQRPQSVEGVVLLNSAGPFTPDESETDKPKPNAIREGIGKGLRSLLLQPWACFFLFQYVRRKSMIRKTLKKVYVDQGAVTDRLVDEIFQPSCDKGALQVFASVFRARQGAKVDELLAQMSCPLLLIWGEGDPWMNTRGRSQQFRRHYSNLTEHFINSGHCPHDESPELVNQLVSDWVMESVIPRPIV